MEVHQKPEVKVSFYPATKRCQSCLIGDSVLQMGCCCCLVVRKSAPSQKMSECHYTNLWRSTLHISQVPWKKGTSYFFMQGLGSHFWCRNLLHPHTTFSPQKSTLGVRERHGSHDTLGSASWKMHIPVWDLKKLDGMTWTSCLNAKVHIMVNGYIAAIQNGSSVSSSACPHLP